MPSNPETVGQLLDQLPPTETPVAEKPKRAPRRAKAPAVIVKKPAFEKHGLRTLSASSLRLFRSNPAAWWVRYVLKMKSEMGPPVWRGSAVEAALDEMLFGSGDRAKALVAAEKRWDQDAMGDASNEAMKEYETIPDFLDTAVKYFEKHAIPKPLTKQSKITLQLDELEVPFIGYIDYRWPDELIDLKTTHRMPSEAKPDHVEQVAIYRKSTGLKGKLFYVTSKKAEMKPVTDEMAAEAFENVLMGARALQRALTVFDSAEEALSCIAPDFTAYEWDAPMIEAVKKLKQKGN